MKFSRVAANVASGIVIALAGLLMIVLRLLIFNAKLIVGKAHKIR